MNDLAGQASPPRTTPPWWLLAAGAAACLAYLLVELRLVGDGGGLVLDDSWIHLAFAANLAAGEGLSLNPGELVSGSTAPLWTALLSLLLLLPGPAVLWVKLAGAALYLATGDAVYRLARELRLPVALATLATALTLASGWLVWAALSGLEIPLFVTLSLWGVLLHVRERRRPQRVPRSLAVLAVAVLARPEGLLLLALAFADALLAGGDRRRLLRGAGLAVCVLLPVVLFNLAVGGSPLPTTFFAKAGDRRDWLPSLRHLYSVLGILFRSQPWSVLLAAAGAVELARRWRTPRDGGLLPALWLFGLPLAYAVLSPPGQVIAGNFGRYYFPLFPFLALLAALGLAPLAGWLAPARRQLGRSAALALAAVVILAPTLLSLVRGAGRYAQNVANVEASDVRMARWLGERLPAEAVLAVNDVGALSYLLPNRVVDLAGIGNPELADSMRRAGSREAGIREFLAEHRPDYLVVFPFWFPELLAAGGSFPARHRISIPDNITMGGDELVLYATPWTRHPLENDDRR